MTSVKIYSKEQTDDALRLKQDTLVSGTNIKTVNGNSLIGSGDIQISAQASVKTLANQSLQGEGNVTLDDIGAQAKLTSGTDIKTINSESVLGSGNITVQPTLVSGTNIKTINGSSILGGGDLSISGDINFVECKLADDTSTFTDVRDIANAIKNTFGLDTSGLYLTIVELQQNSIISGESIYYLIGTYNTTGQLNIIGGIEQYDLSKTTYVCIGGRIGGSYTGSSPGSVNQVVFVNTSTNAISIQQITGSFKIYARKIGTNVP